MKFLSVLAFAALSSSAFAQICEVDMVDRYNRVIRTFRAYGQQDACIEGMKECRKTIRLSPQSGGVDCVRAYSQQPQQPQGPQYPQQPQYPSQYPSSSATRALSSGESVIYNNSYYTVVGLAYNGSVALKDSWNQISQGIRRENISVTNGCSQEVCVGKQIIDISSASYQTVAGLRFQDGFILKNSWNQLSSVQRSKVALLEGCSGSYYAQVCVGNQVLTRDNSYQTVVAIQQDGRVVLKNSWNQLSINVDIQSLIVTR